MTAKKTKIVFVLPQLSSGGAERVLITLYNHLNPNAYDKRLVVMNGIGEMGSWIRDGGYINLHAGSVKRGLLPLLKCLRKEKPDIVISTMAHMNFAVLLLKPFLPLKTKFFVREANIPSSIIKGVKLSLLVSLAYKILYPFADKVISPSQKIIDELQNELGLNPRKQFLLYNPVDADRIVPTENTASSHPDRIAFICAGRLHPQKGFDRLIENLHRLSPGLQWTLDIWGEGQERPYLQKLIAENKLQYRVFLKGLSETPWTEMARADALLLPSRWEGLPNVVLESLAVGTQVIASTEAGGIREIANRANGHVQLADTMEAFIAAMNAVEKNIAPTRSSLLPDDFRLQMIMSRFESLLSGSPEE